MGIEEFIQRIKSIDENAKRKIERQWKMFEGMKYKGENAWFSELCFCILTANASADMGIKVQRKLRYEGFAKSKPSQLAKLLKQNGARFYNKRAEYIASSRKYDGKLKKMITSMNNQFKAREWLSRHIKGMGYKEASHFLRNTGHGNLAILDKHILRVLREHDLIGDFKTLSKKRYIAIEHVLRDISDKLYMPLGKLDLYIWYLDTGKVLK